MGNIAPLQKGLRGDLAQPDIFSQEMSRGGTIAWIYAYNYAMRSRKRIKWSSV